MTVNTIGVVGAGMMGSEIALVLALAGKSVLLSDRDRALLDKAVAKLDGILDKGIARGFYTAKTTRRGRRTTCAPPSTSARLRALRHWSSRPCSRTRR